MFTRVRGNLASSSSDFPMYKVDRNIRFFACFILAYTILVNLVRSIISQGVDLGDDIIGLAHLECLVEISRGLDDLDLRAIDLE